jgi:hypothetical protein
VLCQERADGNTGSEAGAAEDLRGDEHAQHAPLRRAKICGVR